MPITFVAAGAVASGAVGSLTPAFPAGVVADDILLCVLESNDNVAVTVPAGWATVGAINSGTTTRSTGAWKRFVAGDVAAAFTKTGTVAFSAAIVAYRGVVNTGNPWAVAPTVLANASGTVATATGVTTTSADNMIVALVGSGLDANSTAHFSAWTSTGTGAMTETVDNAKNTGGGTAVGAAHGIMATAAATGNVTATKSAASLSGAILVALVLPLSVTSSRATTWNVAAQATSSRATTWNVAGAAGLAIDASSPAQATKAAAGTTVTTASFTAPANSLLMAYVPYDTTDAATANDHTVTDSGGLTWTLVARKSPSATSLGGAGRAGGVEIWSAPQATSAARTVTATQTEAKTAALVVKVWTDGGSLPTVGAVAAASALSGLPSVAVTTTAANSWVSAGSSDWAQKGLGTAGAGQTITDEHDAAGLITTHVWRQNAVTAASATAVTMNLTAPDLQEYNILAVEVKAAAGPPADPPYSYVDMFSMASGGM